LAHTTDRVDLLYRQTPSSAIIRYDEDLLHPQHTRASPVCCLFLLVTLVESHRTRMVSTHVVEVFHLVDPDDPIFACEGLLERVELRAFSRQF